MRRLLDRLRRPRPYPADHPGPDFPYWVSGSPRILRERES